MTGARTTTELPPLASATVAKTLGVSETAAQDLDETLKAYLAERQMLLVLDNFEQLVTAAPAVARLLAGALAGVDEDAGAVAVMALERVPADIRAEGGVARMASPRRIREIMAAVTIPVMAKVRIGHFAEAQILEALGVDFIDESEVLTPADEEHPAPPAVLDVILLLVRADVSGAMPRSAMARPTDFARAACSQRRSRCQRKQARRRS